MPDKTPWPDVRDRLIERARLLRAVRGFFEDRGLTEVDTPALSGCGNPDPAVEPIRATTQVFGSRPLYLHTSPELAMKRLLVAGSGDIWQLCRVFRDGELGRWHEPEFMMLEWYRLGFDEHELMTEVGELLNTCFASQTLPVFRLTYAQAFSQATGLDPHLGDRDLESALSVLLAERGIDAPAGLDVAGRLDLAAATLMIPQLPRNAIVFVHDYPARQAALAALRATLPPVAARFEVFVNGIELGNGFRELTDPAEQRDRFAADNRRRETLGLRPIEPDEAFLAALDSGLPACAGVAVGFDRLAAIATGQAQLSDAMTLAHASRPGPAND